MATWNQIAPILDALFDLSGTTRETQLVALCGGDSDLETEIRDLLLAAEQTRWERNLAEDAAARMLESALIDLSNSEDLSGELVGNYRLARLVGRGGMGAVYLAERADGTFEQTVAVKILPTGTGGEHAQTRFDDERQILARLQHEHIAQLFDGGLSDSGTPYFVMEFVEGVPIDAFCRSRGLERAARIQLFDSVCAAVAYAHSNLVIHRDIKPDNILVNDAGVPKLLDFGVAAVLDRAEDAIFANNALTPNYAAPEQISAGEATTLSDLYSLGALLYLLIADKPAFQHRAQTYLELRDAALNRTVDPPCEDAELNSIVSRALAAAPVDRYDSVSALRADLARWQKQEPVAAYPSTLWYVSRKFVARNRLAVAGTALLACAILVGAAATTWQAQQTVRQAERAERVSDFLQSLFDAANPFGAWKTEKTVQDLLDYASARFATELADEPEVLAEMQNVLGVAHIGNGQYERARDLLADSLVIRNSRLGEDSLATAESANNLAWALIELGEYEQAIPYAERALGVYSAALGRRSIEAAAAMTNLAAARSNAGEKEAAKILHTEALSIRRELLPRDHTDIADSLMSLTAVQSALGEHANVLPLNKEAHAIYVARYGKDHPMSVRAMNGIASGEFLARNYVAAAAVFRDLLTISEQRLGPGHPELALYLNNLGRVLSELGEFTAARQTLERAVEIVDQGHPQRMLTISVQYNYANVLAELGELDEARTRLDDAVAQFAAALGQSHPLVARSRVQSARLTALEGAPDRALDELQKLTVTLEQPTGNPAWLAEAKLELARLHNAAGRLQQARKLIAAAKPVFMAAFPNNGWRRIDFELQEAVAFNRPADVAEQKALLASLLPEFSSRLKVNVRSLQ